MLVSPSFCLLFIALLYLNTVESLFLPSVDLAEQKNAKLSDELLFERFALGSRPSTDEDELDEFRHAKRQLKRKWNKFHPGAQSPYTIAFPALIRTRRSTHQ